MIEAIQNALNNLDNFEACKKLSESEMKIWLDARNNLSKALRRVKMLEKDC